MTTADRRERESAYEPAGEAPTSGGGSRTAQTLRPAVGQFHAPQQARAGGDSRRWWTYQQFADALASAGLPSSPRTLRRLVKRAGLPVRRINHKTVRIDARAARAWIAAQ